MKTIFKVGDVVHCCLFGEGVVKETSNNATFPIWVQFRDTIETYTFDGRLNELINPTLSLTPYTLEGFSQERKTDWNEYVGEWGFFWDNDSENKQLGILDEYDNSLNSPFVRVDGEPFDHFQPLTPEIKQLLIEQGIINISNSTPLK